MKNIKSLELLQEKIMTKFKKYLAISFKEIKRKLNHTLEALYILLSIEGKQGPTKKPSIAFCLCYKYDHSTISKSKQKTKLTNYFFFLN